ncbi:expressed unknown protein [Seminavis robusta]|uniref:Uncharacterized protein n=1 Tax=Seminavis robusta TaxID=568900 RepID=A0A9N8DR23_9STRA|nr:expressed unknown protein [Seminavis robusta]|eukprot:Sro310_g113980.1 n/a (206) ;mRNA; f:15772-16389
MMHSSVSSPPCPIAAADDKLNRLVQRKRGMFRRANSIESLFGQLQQHSIKSRPNAISRVVSDGMNDTSRRDELISTPPLLIQRWDSGSQHPRSAARTKQRKSRKKIDRPPSPPSSSGSRLGVMRNHVHQKRSSLPEELLIPAAPISSTLVVPSREEEHHTLNHCCCRWDSDSSLNDTEPKTINRPTGDASPVTTAALRERFAASA